MLLTHDIHLCVCMKMKMKMKIKTKQKRNWIGYICMYTHMFHSTHWMNFCILFPLFASVYRQVSFTLHSVDTLLFSRVDARLVRSRVAFLVVVIFLLLLLLVVSATCVSVLVRVVNPEQINQFSIVRGRTCVKSLDQFITTV